MNAQTNRELAIQSESPSGATDVSQRTTPALDSSNRQGHTWSLTDFRRWWTSPSRCRWLCAVRLAPTRDLTNFGNLV
jgi:hypothetical protein